MENYEIVIKDFDEIADLTEPKWNHNNCYFPKILKLLPRKMENVLDIGCGKGELSYLLANKCDKVTAVDISPKMICAAKLKHFKNNIDYINGNILNLDFSDGSFDAIVTTATAHHLPFEWLLTFAKNKLKKDGFIIILDLAEAKTIFDYLFWGSAFFPNIFMNIIYNGNIKKDDEHARNIWKKHGEHDKYMTINEIKKIANIIIPGASIKRKLFFRYFLIWKK